MPEGFGFLGAGIPGEPGCRRWNAARVGKPFAGDSPAATGGGIGSDLKPDAAAAPEGRSIFLLGGEKGTADAAAAVLRERSANLKVAGTLCPPLGFEMDEAEMGKIIETLQAARPDIVYVALGSPKQEQLIHRLRRAMPQSWWLGVGVSFSFLCGDVKRRAPVDAKQRIGMGPSRDAGAGSADSPVSRRNSVCCHPSVSFDDEGHCRSGFAQAGRDGRRFAGRSD